jgi:hypothetical protein
MLLSLLRKLSRKERSIVSCPEWTRGGMNFEGRVENVSGDGDVEIWRWVGIPQVGLRIQWQKKCRHRYWLPVLCKSIIEALVWRGEYNGE